MLFPPVIPGSGPAPYACPPRCRPVGPPARHHTPARRAATPPDRQPDTVRPPAAFPPRRTASRVRGRHALPGTSPAGRSDGSVVCPPAGAGRQTRASSTQQPLGLLYRLLRQPESDDGTPGSVRRTLTPFTAPSARLDPSMGPRIDTPIRLGGAAGARYARIITRHVHRAGARMRRVSARAAGHQRWWTCRRIRRS
jgi:hypothetical protein